VTWAGTEISFVVVTAGAVVVLFVVGGAVVVGTVVDVVGSVVEIVDVGCVVDVVVDVVGSVVEIVEVVGSVLDAAVVVVVVGAGSVPSAAANPARRPIANMKITARTGRIFFTERSSAVG
jgi:hypothetical protein